MKSDVHKCTRDCDAPNVQTNKQCQSKEHKCTTYVDARAEYLQNTCSSSIDAAIPPLQSSIHKYSKHCFMLSGQEAAYLEGARAHLA